MTDTNKIEGGADIFGCRDELAGALDQPELASFDGAGPFDDDARWAAYRLAVALGECRLFGVQVDDELDGVLPPAMAAEAMDHLAGLLLNWTQDARRLPEEWDEAAGQEPLEAEDLAIGLLENRMEAWAAWIAGDEAFAECDEAGDPAASALARAVDHVLPRIEEFDGELRRQTDFLAAAAQTELLSNWRRCLASPYRDAMPWWLDGTLEAAAERVIRDAAATMPGPDVWRRFRDAVARQRASQRLRDGWLAPVYRPALAAAAGEPEAPTLPPVEWASPDGAFRAWMVVPVRPERGDDDDVAVRFEDAEGRTTAAFDGQTVALASVPGKIAGGRAVFALGKLRRTGEPPVLAVGEPPAAWILKPL